MQRRPQLSCVTGCLLAVVLIPLLSALFPAAHPAQAAESDLDPDFDHGMYIHIGLTALACRERVGVAVAAQPDGKIVLAGFEESTLQSFVARLDATSA